MANSRIFSVSNGYNANVSYPIQIPKCSSATLQIFGAGGGGGCGEELFSPYFNNSFLYTGMGGGGGGSGTYLELQVDKSLLSGNTILYFILGAGGVGGKHNTTPNSFNPVTLAGGNGGSTQLTYTFDGLYPAMGYYETYTAVGGEGGGYGTLDGLNGNGGNGGNGYTYSANLPPNTGSNFFPLLYKSFGGGGGLYVNPTGTLNVGGLGGSGYASDFTIPASYLAGTSGTFSNINGNVHAGFGGGSLASIGGSATSFTIFQIDYLLNGAGSGASPGNAAPINRQNVISNPVSGGGAGYKSLAVFSFTDALAPVKASSGGGGGGGVGGVTNPPVLATYEINGQDAGAGGNGKIILSYTV